MARLRGCWLVAIPLWATTAHAQVFSRWDFNSISPDPSTGGISTGTITPTHDHAATPSGVLALTGTSYYHAGSPNDPANPAGDNSAFTLSTFAAPGSGSGTRGLQVNVSTAALAASSPLVLGFDWWGSPSSSRHAQVQYTTNRHSATPTWTLLSSLLHASDSTWSSVTVVVPAAATAARDAAGFAMRIVAVFAPGTADYEASRPGGSYSAGGNWRFDLVTLSVPEPGGPLALATLAMAGLCRRRVR